MADNKNQIEKGINLYIYECKENIARAINNVKLPPGITLMILNEFVNQVQILYDRVVEQERKIYEEGVKQNGKEIYKN